MQKNHFLLFAAVFGMLAVILGAFGAHGLEKWLDPQLLKRFHTGVEYQFYHTLALFMTGLLWQQTPARGLAWAGYAFMAGILLFSGSLYAYALSGMKAFGMITPIGGLGFIVGWGLLGWAVWQTPRTP